MLHAFSRTEMLIGTKGLLKLHNSKVAIFGIGGVGTYAAEALARSGVGTIVLIDDDDICLTNINRQLHATRKTVGKSKVETMKNRILEINPKCEVITHQLLYNAENADKLLFDDYDYVVDAIDMVTAKIDLIVRCTNRNIPIMSAMGAGNKMNPTELEVTDIYKTSVCPLARVMRRELKKRRIKKLKVVYSKELPMTPIELNANCKTNCICTNRDRTCDVRHQIPGSIAFVPSVSGLIIASEVVKDLIKE
ncbi:tRNA threonylcarbamoyladenosine dehydratase [Mycoplasmatota bacterium WC44]